MKRTALLLPALLALACSTAPADDQARPAREPLIGKADADATSTDVADRECRVVVRRAERLDDARGTGVNVTVDVAEPLLADPGATPGVLFRNDGGAWQELTALAASVEPPSGFRRFTARFAVGKQADFVGFARTTTAVRLFDHNRLPGDYDAFHVGAGSWSVPEAPSVCPGLAPIADLEFKGTFVTAQHGAIVAGGKLSVDYDLNRLTTCRDTHNGARFWSLDAWAQFSPGGQVVSGSVVASNGTATFPATFTTDVPADATSVQLWFRNATPPSCEGWDSNYGHNYVFAVAAATPVRPGWAGDLGGSFARDCAHRDGLAEPIVIDEYVRERACSFIDGDVWVSGITDGSSPTPAFIAADVEWSRDGAPALHTWLEDVGRVGNNERFRWTLPYELRNVADWNEVKFALRFSTDGRHWVYPEGGARRTITRAFQMP
ncbi:MAG: putative lipoprotein [Myxococcales bacterium]|nr:putative lipoprotein [Myxococcales bacterium]